MAPAPSVAGKPLFPGHMCYLLEYEPPGKESFSSLQAAPLTSENVSLAASRRLSAKPLVDYESSDEESDSEKPSNTMSVGLTYMPSSVPPAIALLEGVGEDISDATPIISSHDWRRLQDVDLDDLVTQYGIKASSTEVISGRRHLWRRKEPFRYGAKDLMTTMGGREDGRFYSGHKRIMIHYASFQHKKCGNDCP